MIFVKYTDTTKAVIESVYSSQQDDGDQIELSDSRYAAFYNSLPDRVKEMLPFPE